MKNKETKTQKRTRLIKEAQELENNLGYIEYKLPSVLNELKKLNPTKSELEDEGVQHLFDFYL